ncbi:MAG: outer membrane beta-barrel protein [Candidatus Sulfotelmatobacter sp.]
MRKLAFLATVFALLVLPSLVLPNLASAQQGDFAIGFGTLVSPGAAACNGLTCPEKGGFYPSVGGDAIFHNRVGVGLDILWRGGQGNLVLGGIPQTYRPIIFDFNGVYQPRLGKKVGLDLVGGIGWQDTRLYLPYCTNSITCDNFTSTKHFLVDVGAGVRYYVWGHVFVRPEARYYHVLNNGDLFTSDGFLRVGASIGYTIGPD